MSNKKGKGEESNLSSPWAIRLGTNFRLNFLAVRKLTEKLDERHHAANEEQRRDRAEEHAGEQQREGLEDGRTTRKQADCPERGIAHGNDESHNPKEQDSRKDRCDVVSFVFHDCTPFKVKTGG